MQKKRKENGHVQVHEKKIDSHVSLEIKREILSNKGVI